MSRRDFIQQGLLLGGLAAAGAAAFGAACGASGGGALTCSDTSALPEADRALRAQLQYGDRSPDPAKTCAKCRFFVAPSSAPACGGCSLVKGPIHPDGHCTSWVAKA